jgi:hypothetical protein
MLWELQKPSKPPDFKSPLMQEQIDLLESVDFEWSLWNRGPLTS